MGYTAVVDYGAGNLMSVTNALSYLGYESRIVNDIKEIERADRIILPGVGAFPTAMEQLKAKGFVPVLREQSGKKPLLGICLGMQMLFDESFEIRACPGLGLIPGVVRRIETDLKLPHIGWNSLDMHGPCPILSGLSQGDHVYFVHSFCAVPESQAHLAATADYGEPVAAVVMRDNIFGCQFHPEKSGDTGLRILENFSKI